MLIQNDNNVHETRYTPRSKRSTWWYATTTTVNKYAAACGNWIESKIGTTPTGSRQTSRARRLKNAVLRIKRPRRGKLRMIVSLLATAAVAMSTTTGTERDVNFDTDSGPVGIDNRCSGCISHEISDFIGDLRPCSRAIKGFGGSKTYNVKIGTLVWRWCDEQGRVHRFKIPNSFYVPDGKVRLLSPQHWAQAQKDEKPIQGTGETTTSTHVDMFWGQREHHLRVPVGKTNNVATFYLAPGIQRYMGFCAEADINLATEDTDPIIADSTLVSDDEEDTNRDTGVPSATRDWNRDWRPAPSSTHDSGSEAAQPTSTSFDLDGPPSEGETTKPQVIDDEEDRQPTNIAAELLRYHQRLGHISFKKLQEMAKQGTIPKRLAKCPIPVCSACMYAKATKRPWKGKTRRVDVDPDEKPKGPGQVVSVDQMVSPTPGLIAQMTGFLTTKRYKYATVYVDQATRLGFVYLQKTASADETLEGKEAFERYARDRGITIHAYHADNGIFKAYKWVEACRIKGQGLTFAGVNAHHQNGLAERRIRELQELARSMLIHASKRWPTCVSMNLWPYAVRMANDVFNNTPSLQDKERNTPCQLFERTKVTVNPKHWMPFGCPIFVLENDLQSGQGIFNKWKDRAKVGIYLGMSPKHARNVALVLDRTTSLVSPQFHVKFDPSFHSTKQDEFGSLWQIKAGFVAQREKETLSPGQTIVRPSKRTSQTEGVAGQNPAKRTSQTEGVTGQKPAKKSKNQLPEPPKQSGPAAATDSQSVPEREKPLEESPRGSESGAQPEHRRMPEVRKSGRQRQPVQRLVEAMMTEIRHDTAADIEGEIFCLQSMYPKDDSALQDPLQAYKATTDPDTMYLHEAMKAPDRKEFVKAMEKEWKDQLSNGNFSVIKRSEVPADKPILPAVWQMKRKRDIKSGRVKKHKARLNIDGSRMKQGEHYDETYAPVASWNSVRMLLAMTAVHNWHTTQIDYVLAFPQAPVERDIYMKIPKGFEIDEGNTDDYVLRLHRNVYGQKQAGRVWNQYLVDKLVNEVGFTQSKVDACVFYRGKTVYLLYTDDSILAGPDQKEIDQCIEDIKKAKLDITVEGDLQDFLGVNIERKEDGIHLTQPHLIKQILKDLRLDGDDVKGKDTPASSSKLLSRHSDSPPFDASFNYRSVIGKINYLEKATRSDIAYIGHQCARFTSDPKKEHCDAIRWLGRYLKATQDKGLILKPSEHKDLELYCDADFAGNWDSHEAGHDRDTARSRHGYIIMYANCPIVWKSQMQTEIALSSTESEYTGLSYALREVIPIMELLKEMKEHGFPVRTAGSKVHCRAFEDNTGALEIAKTHKYRPRTKHLNVKLHHFRDYVTRGEISIHHIDTNDQLADYLTKPVNLQTMERLRPLVMGW
jgi:hypothetical protein